MRKTLDLSNVLAPLGEFGRWIGGLLPTFEVTIQEYIKIPLLPALPEFIIAIEAKVNFNCGILNKIGDALVAANKVIIAIDPGQKLSKFLWPDWARKFCSEKQGLSIKMSLGFKGFYPDPPTTYVEANGKQFSMADFPVCPAPVKHVGASDLTLVFFCSNNDISHLLSVFRVASVR